MQISESLYLKKKWIGKALDSESSNCNRDGDREIKMPISYLPIQVDC